MLDNVGRGYQHLLLAMKMFDVEMLFDVKGFAKKKEK